MRFLLGLLLGFALGFGGALLFAPERRRDQDADEPASRPSGRTFDTWRTRPEREETRPRASENHDFTAGLRRALRSLQDEIQEAWSEAVLAAEEAEKELRERYQRTVRTARRRQ